jgi:hypothetical protein
MIQCKPQFTEMQLQGHVVMSGATNLIVEAFNA